MAIKSRRNEYLGVNAHLHSYFQNHPDGKGDWESFYTLYIADLARAINRILPPGYLVLPERSMQIREYDTDTGARLIKRPKPDIAVYDLDPARQPANPPGAAVATRTHTVSETLDDDEDIYYPAVVIYELQEDASGRVPVTHLELLAPTNKVEPGRTVYLDKRKTVLRTGINLVEIDYLHQTEPVVRVIPSYPRQQPDATAYTILVSQPRRDAEGGGPVTTYGFGVDIPIPTIDIPLARGETIPVNFGAVYHDTLNSLAAFSEPVDYAALPERFDSYHPADQERIRRRMAAVAEAVR